MTEISEVIVHIEAKTRLARAVMWALYPLVFLRLMSPERAVSIGMKFVRIKAR